MALRQTYLSLKNKLPEGAEHVLVIRGRGNDELAPSAELLAKINRLKAEYRGPEDGFASASDFAWSKSEYTARFRKQILSNPKSLARLAEISARAKDHDIFLICYEAYDKPCHRHLLLDIAEHEFGAPVDYTPFLPPGALKASQEDKRHQPALF